MVHKERISPPTVALSLPVTGRHKPVPHKIVLDLCSQLVAREVLASKAGLDASDKTAIIIVSPFMSLASGRSDTQVTTVRREIWLRL